MSMAEEMLFEGEVCIRCGDVFEKGIGPDHPRLCADCDEPQEEE